MRLRREESLKPEPKSYIFALCKQPASKHPRSKIPFSKISLGESARQIPFSDFSPPCEKSSGGTLRKNSRSDPRPTTFPEFLRRRGNKRKARRKTQKRYFSHLRHSPHVTSAREPQPFSFAPVPCRVPRVPEDTGRRVPVTLRVGGRCLPQARSADEFTSSHSHKPTFQRLTRANTSPIRIRMLNTKYSHVLII